ncbi:dihydrolipoyllysine-residue acetyltransferase component 3 of pyruvate dehydrogenase complex, mitochondrial [Cynara cardunculus var. scolymus]|uniref:dihydrolipoyllysine-residue acetyltransferase component 3 of pyruvate dehydrogenase complex, mitochondrial n=1 Tax=Cynara cardunculus var. scolymus TaxID=59895 RepID=UPI000D62CCED|nr:dihydrolipoyllysine-residue acetyltransferase component 3 of pyruvate dehydrogenase complex, mitochondrial [Cynara cardunculus var. scolymus]
MTFASHIIRHSKQLKNAQGLLKQDHAILVRWFSHSTRSISNKGDDVSKLHQINNFPGQNICVCKSCSGFMSSTPIFTRSYRAANPTKVQNGLAVRTEGTSVSGMVFSRGISCNNAQLGRRFSTNSGLPPHQELGMPSLSPTMTEGNIARWLKKEGDQVAPGEVLCEVETDKATVEMECMEEGYLAKIIHGDGAKEIKVGEVIAITVEDKDDIEKFKDYKPQASDAASPEAPPAPTPAKEDVVEKPISPPEPKAAKPSAAPETDRVFASPLARKLAEDHNVSLSSIKGTGPDGSIVKADIEEYLASGAKAPSAATSKADKATVSAINYSDIPHSQIRKITASRLLLSKQTIPHYYLTVDTCVDKLTKLRAELNSIQEASGGKKISINDLVIKAAALALRKVPQCNSSWTNDYIRQFHDVHINVAVQTDNGLYVPVVRDADKKGLSKISEDVKILAQKARENSLKPDDYEGGTFTVSNLGGPFGIKQFCAIINPPQAGILAVGSAERRVIPGSGAVEFKFASFMPVTLSCDHRVIDGAIGAEWLKAFKGYIENPETMLL